MIIILTEYYMCKYGLEHYQDFDRHIEKEQRNFDRSFLYQDSCCSPTEPDQTDIKKQMKK